MQLKYHSAVFKVSGTDEKLMNYNELPREQPLEKAKSEAVGLAVEVVFDVG